MTTTRTPISLRMPARALPLAAALFTAQAVLADEVDDAGSQIVVTAEKTVVNPFADPKAPLKIDRSASEKLTVPLLDLPRTMTVIPQALIQDLGATSFRDLVRTQPGVTLGTGEGGNAFGDRIFIRGFDARNDVYIDGLRDPGVTSREVFAVQQIEILKGPSSSYGGRGTTGGSVSFITKAPQAKGFELVEATLGTDKTKRITADINVPLSETFQVRVNGLFHDGDVAGRDDVWNRRWGAAAAFAWQATPDVDFGGDYYHLETTGLPDWGMPFDTTTQQPFDVPRTNFYGITARDFSTSNVDIVTLKFEARSGDFFTVDSKVRYGSNLNAYIASAPERPVTTNPDPSKWTISANPKNRNADVQTYANATDFHFDFATGSIKHALVTGWELSREITVSQPFAFASSEVVGAPVVPTIPIIQNLWEPDSSQPWPYARTLSGVYANTKVVSKSAYILDTIDLSPKWQLSGGLRYDNYQLRFYQRNANGTRVSLENDSDFFNWNVGLVFKPVPAGSLYVSASTSSNPSGEQVDASGVAYGGIAPSTANLDPEHNESFEAGAKWQVANNHLLLTGALFRTNKTNARVADPTQGGTITLSGTQRVQGVELGVSGNITPKWEVSGGYVHLDAKVLTSPIPAEVGQPFPNIPADSGSVFSSYHVTDALTLGGQAAYVGTRYGGTSVAGTANIPAYWRFDATARYRFNNRFEVQANLLNLTDKVYYDAIYRSASPFAYIAPGRSLLVTLRVNM
jgi:catecholate siderophore receptor